MSLVSLGGGVLARKKREGKGKGEGGTPQPTLPPAGVAPPKLESLGWGVGVQPGGAESEPCEAKEGGERAKIHQQAMQFCKDTPSCLLSVCLSLSFSSCSSLVGF